MNARLLIVLGVAAAVVLGFILGRRSAGKPQNAPFETRVDTLYVRDTIKVKEPVYIARRVVDSIPYPVTDTLRMHDTLYMYLAREQVRWEDSLSVVYASGIDPMVDSVIHYTQDRVIAEQIPVVQVKKTRCGIGVQAGYGATIDKNVVSLSPYVGVGVCYNFLSL
jgi:hypothetical protein